MTTTPPGCHIPKDHLTTPPHRLKPFRGDPNNPFYFPFANSYLDQFLLFYLPQLLLYCLLLIFAFSSISISILPQTCSILILIPMSSLTTAPLAS